MRLVFYYKRGGSGKIRGAQVANFLGAQHNPSHTRRDDVHVWVKQQPPDSLPLNSHLDIIDGMYRIGWLLRHPECGVIASSESGYEYLQRRLSRDDIILIPQHHANFGRVRRVRNDMQSAGVVGGQGSIQCDFGELKRTLGGVGMSFHWLERYKGPPQIVQFYNRLDVQIVWRERTTPLKNPLKLVNAMSLGIPTIAFPEEAYKEVQGYYWPVTSIEEVASVIEQLREGFDADRLIVKAEEYHIENIAPLYGGLL